MKYRLLLTYDQDANFVGWVINAVGTPGLRGSNIFEDQVEAQRQVNLLNEDVDIRAFWPDHRDHDVQALLNNPNWEPLEMVEETVVDEDKSYLVYNNDEETEDPITGEKVKGVLDRDASVFAYKTIQVAKYPVQITQRSKKAMETVARHRAEERGTDVTV